MSVDTWFHHTSYCSLLNIPFYNVKVHDPQGNGFCCPHPLPLWQRSTRTGDGGERQGLGQSLWESVSIRAESAFESAGELIGVQEKDLPSAIGIRGGPGQRCSLEKLRPTSCCAGETHLAMSEAQCITVGVTSNDLWPGECLHYIHYVYISSSTHCLSCHAETEPWIRQSLTQQSNRNISKMGPNSGLSCYPGLSM